MFKTIRIGLLLFVLLSVAVGSWQAQQRSNNWSQTLWVKLYPINASGNRVTADYIAQLRLKNFAGIESFFQRESERYGHRKERSVLIELGREIADDMPRPDNLRSALDAAIWSLKMRWWIWRVAAEQDDSSPHVRVFVRYHDPGSQLLLEDSLGVRKGMFGIVNGFAGRYKAGRNNVVIAHELLHVMGATDKYDRATGLPIAPEGLADPNRAPLYPQRKAEIMGGRIALSANDAREPRSLKSVVIGPLTAREVKLLE